MAFFREFLIENNETPDPTYSEKDEAALVLFLLQARLRGSAVGITVPDDFNPDDEVYRQLAVRRSIKDSKFIAGFLCFFVSKPFAYMRDMEAFKQYFIPGFATDRRKQVQLAEALRVGFFNATLENVQTAPSLGLFLDISAIGA